MKTNILSLTGLLLMAIPLAAQRVNTHIEPPTDAVVAIHVESSGKGVIGVQTRNIEGERDGNLQITRGIGQSFQWNSSDKLHGIGLHLHSDQSKFPWSSHHEQLYLLHISRGHGPELVPPLSKVETFSVLIPGSLISNTGNKYLYFEGLDISLEKGSWYGFQLAPAQDSFSPTRLFFSASDTDYAGNTTAIRVELSGFPCQGAFTNDFGGAKDFVFFLTTKKRR